MTLSPDGSMFAAKPNSMTTSSSSTSRPGRRSRRLPLAGLRLDSWPSIRSESAGPCRKMATIAIHSLPDGRREQEIKVDRWVVRDGWCPHPRRQVPGRAASRDGRSKPGQFRRPLERRDGRHMPAVRRARRCLGIAMSRDGTRLASVIDAGDGVRVLQLELAGPKSIPEFKVTASDLFGDDGYQGPIVEWLPDGKHLLVAGTTGDRCGRSEIARTLPPPPVAPLVSAGRE